MAYWKTPNLLIILTKLSSTSEPWFPLGLRRKVLEKMISQQTKNHPGRDKCWRPKDLNLSLVVLPLPSSISTNTQRCCSRSDTLSAFEPYFWSICLEIAHPNPRKKGWLRSYEAPVLHFGLRMGRWGYQELFIWKREPLAESTWCWLKKTNAGGNFREEYLPGDHSGPHQGNAGWLRNKIWCFFSQPVVLICQETMTSGKTVRMLFIFIYIFFYTTHWQTVKFGQDQYRFEKLSNIIKQLESQKGMWENV